MKTCLGCKHCTFYAGAPGYSEMTPGEAMVFQCEKKIWDAEDANGKSELKSMMDMANDCEFYQEEDKP